jgi:hypothetical protein
MTPVLTQEVFGNRPIRDAASGKIATIVRDRHLNYRWSTNSTAALGAWEDTFSSITNGISNLTNSVSNIIGSIKGNTTIVSPQTNQPYLNPTTYMPYTPQPYMPYNPTNPYAPAYKYPVQTTQPVQQSSTNNTALYTALGVAAFGLIIFLKK